MAVRAGKIRDKQASKLSKAELHNFTVMELDSGVILTLHENDINLSSTVAILNSYTKSFQDLVDSKPIIDEVNDLQPLSRSLIQNLIELLKAPVTMRSGVEDIEFVYLGIVGLRIIGETDAAICSREVRVATWEDKNPVENITNAKHLAQALTAIDATAFKFIEFCNLQPILLCGMMTNGKDWILFTRMFSDGNVLWRRTEPVSAVENADKVASMLLEYFDAAIALKKTIDKKRSEELIAIVKKRGIAETDSNNHDHNLENNEDGNGGGESYREGPPTKCGNTSSNLSYHLTTANLRQHDYITFMQLF